MVQEEKIVPQRSNQLGTRKWIWQKLVNHKKNFILCILVYVVILYCMYCNTVFLIFTIARRVPAIVYVRGAFDVTPVYLICMNVQLHARKICNRAPVLHCVGSR
jgi:hypothetical protein